MDPATAFWLTAQDNESHLAEAKAALKLQDRELVICPINDSSDCSLADGGSHWTLLVCWDRRSPRCNGNKASKGASAGPSDFGFFGRFSYYDSLASSMSGGKDANLQQAEALASRLAGHAVQVSVGSCAHQTNGFDCGVYVLLFSEIVASTFLEAHVGHGQSRVNSDPVWEERLAVVTPKEA